MCTCDTEASEPALPSSSAAVASISTAAAFCVAITIAFDRESRGETEPSVDASAWKMVGDDDVFVSTYAVRA